MRKVVIEENEHGEIKVTSQIGGGKVEILSFLSVATKGVDELIDETFDRMEVPEIIRDSLKKLVYSIGKESDNDVVTLKANSEEEMAEKEAAFLKDNPQYDGKSTKQEEEKETPSAYTIHVPEDGLLS